LCRILGIQNEFTLDQIEKINKALIELYGGSQDDPIEYAISINQRLTTLYTAMFVENPKPDDATIIARLSFPEKQKYENLAIALGIQSSETQTLTINIDFIERTLPNPQGGAKMKVKVLGRQRNVIVKGRSKYVNVKGELMLLSAAKKLEKMKK
jgi:hypothetical protein